MHKPYRSDEDKYSHPSPTKTATVNDFGGGLNFIDDELNLNSKYAVALDNLYRANDGRLRLRYGTRLFASLPGTTSGNVVNLEYFNDFLIVATTAGEIVKINSSGVATKIWPSGVGGEVWSSGLTTVSFTQFRGELYIVNGVDKPIRIKADMTIQFLGDPGNANSNANTPIARYVTTTKEYTIMAGQVSTPSKVYISARQSGGTWPGDVAPNDSTTIDVGASVSRGDAKIVGLASLNNYVLVFFEETIVILELGTYSSTGVHLVNVYDVIPNSGTIAYRTTRLVDIKVLYADVTGVGSIQRNQFGTSFIPDRESRLIDPQLQQDLAAVRTNSGVSSKCFAIYHKELGLYMLFVKRDGATPMRVWVLNSNKQLEIHAWSTFSGWEFEAACVSALGRVFLASTRAVYIYGSLAAADEFYTDNGAAISFTWELPWSVFQQYDRVKRIQSTRIFTRGTAVFTFQMFVNNIYKDANGNLNPTSQMEFTGGGSSGFGGGLGTDPYGGGRVADDPRIFKFDGRFIESKFRFSGTASTDIQFVAITTRYVVGGNKP